jgi:hypothetical protein
MNKHKTHAESSRDKELIQIENKGVFYPIHRIQLNKNELKNIIKSKIFFNMEAGIKMVPLLLECFKKMTQLITGHLCIHPCLVKIDETNTKPTL